MNWKAIVRPFTVVDFIFVFPRCHIIKKEMKSWFKQTLIVKSFIKHDFIGNMKETMYLKISSGRGKTVPMVLY
jgi:hypothetical protein